MARARGPQQDWYEVLGLAPGAAAAEVKAAHRRLAREWHPDTNAAPEAHSRMRDINRAREVLLDPVARAEFDRARRAAAPIAARPRPAEAKPGREIHIRVRRPQAASRAESPPAETTGAEAAPPRRRPPGRHATRPDFERDWYAFLGVSPHASDAEIRAALRRAALALQVPGISAVEFARRSTELRTANASIGTTAARAGYHRQRGIAGGARPGS